MEEKDEDRRDGEDEERCMRGAVGSVGERGEARGETELVEPLADAPRPVEEWDDELERTEGRR
jgi:hypothetical protein